jgi:hypothetical protein
MVKRHHEAGYDGHGQNELFQGELPGRATTETAATPRATATTSATTTSATTSTAASSHEGPGLFFLGCGDAGL